MKHILFTVLVFFGFASQCQTDTSAQLKFDTTVWDFGIIEHNVHVRHKFWFKNTGTVPIIIFSASGSGGAMPSNWTKEPVFPGDSEFVEVLYNAGILGPFNKVITVRSNAGEFYLKIKGQVRIGHKITFEKTEHDFGDIPQNIAATAEFIFTNTGDMPLIIVNVSSGCGCIVPEYSKEPVMPGKTGWVNLVYNASNPGNFTKLVTVSSNTGEISLTIRGKVVYKPSEPEPVTKPTE